MPLNPLAVAALATAAFGLLPAAALAGDAVEGERLFSQCRACHGIVSPSGETIQRGGRVGPNLYGIVGRQAGTIPGVRYREDLVAAGQAGLAWTRENFIAYMIDPNGFVEAFLRAAGQTPSGTGSGMAFRMRQPAQAADVYAYLQGLSSGFEGGGAVFGQTAACGPGQGPGSQAVAVRYEPSEFDGPPSGVTIAWPDGSEHVSLWGAMTPSGDFLGGAGRQSWTRFVFYPTRPLIRVVARQVTSPPGAPIDQALEVFLRLRVQNFGAVAGCAVTLAATLRRM